MTRAPAAIAGLVLALTGSAPALANTAISAPQSAQASSVSPAVAAAAREFTAGKHVYVASGAAPLDAAALEKSIGDKAVFVAALPSSGGPPDATLVAVASMTRVTGTYVVIDGDAIRASSNSLPAGGVEAVRLAALDAHADDTVAAVDAFVASLLSGGAESAAGAAPSPAVGDPSVARPAPAPASKNTSLPPALLALLIPILAAVGYAVARSRRRTG